MGEALKVRTLHATRTSLTAVAMAALMLAPGAAHALGLGRMVVQSALGEAMRAEIDVTALTPEEAATLQLRVAPAESYRAAGVEYSPVLAGTQVSLQRRADGRAYLRLSSDRAVQEPFVDVILELTWANGRLVREYTLLFDPPANRGAAAASSTGPSFSVPPPPPAAPPVAAAPAPVPAPSPAPAPAARAPAAAATAASASAPKAAAPKPDAAPAKAPASVPARTSEYKVRAGDTLTGVAKRLAHQGVSLDQMLVAIHRGNPDAFINGNMNLLRSGAVLGIPAADVARSTSSEQARQVIQAQSADFDAYRRRLASGVAQARTESVNSSAKGQVQAQVEDRKPAVSASPDKLTLAQGSVKAGASAEANISKAAEKKAESDRLAELSRNVEDLKKIKSATAPAAPASGSRSGKGIEVVSVPALVPASAAAPKVAASAGAPKAAAASAAGPASDRVAAAASAPRVPPAPPAPAPAPEASGVLDNPWVLPGAGVLAALLVAFGAYRMRGRLRKGASETSFLESRLQPDSFFGASGGQQIDTREATPSGSQASSAASSMSYSLSQLDAIGDVDPVAEADVYLAYGRDLQAEEILKEAMRATPERLAVRTKLLEVYGKRRDSKGFELLATQLYSLTQGKGADWEKAQDLGRQLDPENALYQPGGTPSLTDDDGHQVAEPLSASTQPYSALSKPDSVPPERFTPDTVGLDLDLDLDLAAQEERLPELRTRPMPSPLDVAPAPTPAPAEVSRFDLDDLDFDLDSAGKPAAPTPAITSLAQAPQASSLDFDLGSISLDLGEPPAIEEPVRMASAQEPAPGASARDSQLGGLYSQLPETPSMLPDETGDPLQRKLELADEFRQIGDMEGARDLLEEVVASSQGAMKAKAQAMLENLA